MQKNTSTGSAKSAFKLFQTRIHRRKVLAMAGACASLSALPATANDDAKGTDGYATNDKRLYALLLDIERLDDTYETSSDGEEWTEEHYIQHTSDKRAVRTACEDIQPDTIFGAICKILIAAGQQGAYDLDASDPLERLKSKGVFDARKLVLGADNKNVVATEQPTSESDKERLVRYWIDAANLANMKPQLLQNPIDDPSALNPGLWGLQISYANINRYVAGPGPHPEGCMKEMFLQLLALGRVFKCMNEADEKYSHERVGWDEGVEILKTFGTALTDRQIATSIPPIGS